MNPISRAMQKRWSLKQERGIVPVCSENTQPFLEQALIWLPSNFIPSVPGLAPKAQFPHTDEVRDG